MPSKRGRKRKPPVRKSNALTIIKIAALNKRVASALDRLKEAGFETDSGYPVRYFELGFLNFKSRLGRQYTMRIRKRILNDILTGKLRLEHKVWVERLEDFVDAIVKLNKG